MFTVLNFNIRSIPKNFQYFSDTILHLSFTFSALGLTKVRLAPHLSSLYLIPGFTLFSNSRNVHDVAGVIHVSNVYESYVFSDITISDNLWNLQEWKLQFQRENVHFLVSIDHPTVNSTVFTVL